ncbi:MAG: hypothetical protein N3I35_11085 [Clostridia bacterium]|nr:hypothetical protein [Clostridia bacterium]
MTKSGDLLLSSGILIFILVSINIVLKIIPTSSPVNLLLVVTAIILTGIGAGIKKMSL